MPRKRFPLTSPTSMRRVSPAACIATPLAVRDRTEGMAPECPTHPPPAADQDPVTARPQPPSDPPWTRAATDLRAQFEDLIGVGEGSRPAPLECNPSLGVEPHPRDGLAD